MKKTSICEVIGRTPINAYGIAHVSASDYANQSHLAMTRVEPLQKEAVLKVAGKSIERPSLQGPDASAKKP